MKSKPIYKLTTRRAIPSQQQQKQQQQMNIQMVVNLELRKKKFKMYCIHAELREILFAKHKTQSSHVINSIRYHNVQCARRAIVGNVN